MDTISAFNVYNQQELDFLKPYQDDVNEKRYAFREVACANYHRTLDALQNNVRQKCAVGKFDGADSEYNLAFIDAENEYDRTRREYMDSMVIFGSAQRRLRQPA